MNDDDERDYAEEADVRAEAEREGLAEQAAERAALWAVHVEGPDDVLAMRDREDAETQAQAINDMYEKWSQRADHNAALDPRWHAVVMPWPYDADGHAESLAEQAAEQTAADPEVLE